LDADFWSAPIFHYPSIHTISSPCML
jgi:hypothetical protein